MSYLKRKISDKDYYLALANRPRNPGRISQFRGVTKGNTHYPFRAQLCHKGKRYYLGNYKTEHEAAEAYNRAALKIIGSHAVLNEIKKEVQKTDKIKEQRN